MPSWTLHCWHGPPDTVAAAMRALGWHAPGEHAPQPDPRVGGFLPAAGQPLRVLDGTAYAAVVATEPLPLPDGLDVTGAELSTALLGTF